MNFAEEIGYWYLRLNGFFPIRGFVLHRVEREQDRRRYNADGDLLAVRPPHVFERIGGREDDWDVVLLQHFHERTGVNPFERTLGVIAEVKAGLNEDTPGNAFIEERLRDAVARLGLIPKDEVAAFAHTLVGVPCRLVGDTAIILKLFIADVPAQRRGFQNDWYQLPLRCADHFLLRRMRRYAAPKGAARHFFGSELLQYYIWRARQRIQIED